MGMSVATVYPPNHRSEPSPAPEKEPNGSVNRLGRVLTQMSHLLGLERKVFLLLPLKRAFYVYLLASAITAIAAIGSVFEYSSKNPVFGVLESDSIFYAPVLGFFAFTGIPTSVSFFFSFSFFFCFPYLIFVVVSFVGFVCRYSYGSNPLKLLTRKLRNKIKEMDTVKSLLCVFLQLFYNDCCWSSTYFEYNSALLKELAPVKDETFV